MKKVMIVILALLFLFSASVYAQEPIATSGGVIKASVGTSIAHCNSTMVYDTTRDVCVCNSSAVFSRGTCVNCAEGWTKHNETHCAFSQKCFEGYEYDKESKECIQTSTPEFTCKQGYHKEKLGERTRTHDNTTGLTTYTEWKCVENSKVMKTIVKIGILLIVICFFVWLVRRHNNKPSIQEED